MTAMDNNNSSRQIRLSGARAWALAAVTALMLAGCSEEPAAPTQQTVERAKAPQIDGSAESLKNAYDSQSGGGSTPETVVESTTTAPVESDQPVSYGAVSGSEVSRTTEMTNDLSTMVQNLSNNMSGEESVRFLATQREWEAQNFGCPEDTADVGHHSCMQFHIMARMQEIKGRYKSVSTGQINVN